MKEISCRSSILFAESSVNSGRQIELDIARGLAVIFMVLVHVQMSFSNSVAENSWFGNIVDFLGGVPAAPVFMFLMGVGFLYTKNNNHRLFIKRGFYILLGGYVLNFLRGSLPELIDYITDGSKESFINAIRELIDIDILQFAGITIMFFGLIKYMKLRLWVIALLGVGFCLLGYFFSDIQVDGVFSKAITGLIWGSSDISEFPFLTWIFYPILGYFFAGLLIRCKEKRVFYKYILGVSLCGLIVCSYLFTNFLGLDIDISSEVEYYHHNMLFNILFGLFILSWVSVLFLLVSLIPDFLLKQFKRWSRNVTEIYFIHWILIGWVEWFLFPDTFGVRMFLVLFFVIFLVSDLLGYMYNRK